MKDVKTIESVKREAKAITRATSVTHSQMLDVLSVQAGYTHWGAYQEALVQREKDEADRIARTVRPIDLVKALIPDMAYTPMFLERARHIVVSGGTSTGKTTLVNKILTLVPKSVPIVVLDEHGELVNPNPIPDLTIDMNTVRRTGCEGYEISRRAAIRNDAGLLVYGEISTRNAVDVLKAMRDPEGPGILTCIHASNSDDANRVFSERLGNGNAYLDLNGSVACIQMIRDPLGIRRISEVTHL